MRKVFLFVFILILPLSVLAVPDASLSGGIIVELGCGDGSKTAELAISDKYFVHGLEQDAGKVEQARKTIKAKGLYGRISIMQFDGKKLPYVDNLVNQVVVRGKNNVSKEEILRVLVPGGIAIIDGKSIVKPWPKSMDEWTHYLHGADNNAVSLDPTISLPRSLQWVDGQRWGRSHEEFASISAVVSAKGRVFYIEDHAPNASIRYLGQWYLIARDAFNGMELWNKPIKVWNDHLRHFRSGPVHLPRRLVAIDDKVYVTLGLDAPVTELDAATGKVTRTYKGTKNAEEIVAHNGVLYILAGTSEANRHGGGLFGRGEPEPTEERILVALEAETGKELWRKNAKGVDFIMPLGIALSGNKLFFHSIKGLGCLDAKTGKELWLTERKTTAKRYGWSTSTLVVTGDVVLLCDRVESKVEGIASKDMEWGVHGWNVDGFQRRGKTITKAYSAKDGKELWSQPSGEGYNSPTDVFVVNGNVWLGPFNKSQTDKHGYDLKTGEIKKTMNVKGDRVGMAHDRCYRHKASVKYIFMGRDGIELLDFDKGWIRNNSWIRGTCQYGIMPANGLMYAPTDACACHSKSRVQGFNAVSSYKVPSFGKPVVADGRLEKGPAFGKASGAQSSEDWAMYRKDAVRSGSTASKVSKDLSSKWKVDIGGPSTSLRASKLTQPVSIGGKIYVASVNEHTLYALDGKDGKTLWDFTAGGRIDSAPTYYKGLMMFGAADGYVYCIDASSGKLAWRFNAAPEERYVSVYGQIESAWPVHGSVLIQDDELFFTAGRNSYLDGGIYFYRLNPVTGEMLAVSNVTHIDSKTEKQLGSQEAGFDSPGTVTDLLSGDGDSVFLKHMRFDKDGKEVAEPKTHLFTPGGFLGEEWFVRSYWIYGTEMRSGWGGWASSGAKFPAGRIMSIDKDKVYGYGRVEVKSGPVGHKADAYHLFSSLKEFKPEPPKNPKGASKKKKSGGEKKSFLWSKDIKFIVRAFVSTPDMLVTAGVPDLGKKTLGDNEALEFSNEKEALGGFLGSKGVMLKLYSKSDGSQLAEFKLSDMPVFDGMIVADSKVLISLQDGTVQCWE